MSPASGNMTDELNHTLFNYTTEPADIPVSAVNILEYILFAVIFFTSALGNTLVCAVVYHKRSMRTTRNYLIVNLAITDLTVVLICIPVDIMVKAHNGGWPLGHVMCKITFPLMTLLTTNSVGTLVSISGDRYRAIVHPWKARLSLLQTKLMIFCIWMISLISVIPYVIVLEQVGDYCEEIWPEHPDNMHRKLYTATLFMIQYVIPLIIMAAAYGSIGLKLHNQQPVSDAQPSNRESDIDQYDDTSFHEHTGLPSTNGYLVYEVKSTDVDGEEEKSLAGADKTNLNAKRKDTVVNVKQKTSFADTFKNKGGQRPKVSFARYFSQSARQKNTFKSSRRENEVRRHKRKAKVIKMLVAVVLVYALCLLPHQVIWMYYEFGDQNIPNFHEILVFTSLLVYLNTAINPLLYAGMNQEFRKGFASLLSCVFRKRT